MAQPTNVEGLTLEQLRAKYQEEQVKRIRPDGNSQYRALKEHNAQLDVDTYADPNFSRNAIEEETDVVIVGGGFGGMLTGIDLKKIGIASFRIVEKGGDFGGTWYWNRYPGCMCDVESYTYLPLLEETGYMPTMRYASASEIFGYCQLLGRRFDLYDHALFQTEITSAVWDDTKKRWKVGTSRGDTLWSKYIVIAGGILHKPKVPGIPGIQSFEGMAFHTSRWNYDYTGGSPTKPMVNLANKRVGIIGTGATAIQAVPQLARDAKELFVFQRTPSAVGVRDNRPTDEAWFKTLKPGWQAERVENFTRAVTGGQPDKDLVQDGWTDVMWENTQAYAEDPAVIDSMAMSDFNTMGKIRQRVDELVDDPETAEKLKAWWGKNCKRVCFHDEYLPSFNKQNVHLVDTSGKGVEAITPKGAVVDGELIELDLLIYASGFEVQSDLDSRIGFDPIGRDGHSLSQSWSHGAHTMHGVLSGGFPNLMLISLVQGAFGTNFVHFISKAAEHISAVIATCEEQGIESIEATPESEADWLMVLYGEAAGGAQYVVNCSPGYYNGELGAPDEKAAKGLVFAGSLIDWAGHLERWREQGELVGAKVVKIGEPT